MTFSIYFLKDGTWYLYSFGTKREHVAQVLRDAWENDSPEGVKATPDQAAEITPNLRAGHSLLARVMRDPFTGANAVTSGRLVIEFGEVPDSALPELRAIVRRGR